MSNAPTNGNPSKPPSRQAGVILADQVHLATIHADVLALLPDPATARLCLDIAEDAARAVNGTMAAAHVGADPARMVAAPEEIDLQMLRDMNEGSPYKRLEQVTLAFEYWKRERPDRHDLFLDDCCGDLDRCVTGECHETALVVAPCHGNMDARDAFHDLLFNESKLVLVPPRDPYAGNLLEHVVIAWKPHGNAQRAVVAARRWLTVADRVTVLCVSDTPGGSYQFTASELLRQLGLECDIVAVGSDGRPVGHTILDFATSENATCLLIGAYRHGYLLELLLGRITRYLLSHARLPLMLKH